MHAPASPALSIKQILRSLFELRPAPQGRWLFALRAGVCVGVPILVGWLAGDSSAGLMASIGGFTSLYGSGRPYLSRAVELGLIAMAFAASVGLGMLVAPIGWAVVVVVATIAMIATWLSNALQIGTQGAYLFTLACAAASAMPVNHIEPHVAALLVLGGGAFGWLLHMGGALFAPRGPERNAVRTAGRAVIGYIEAIGTSHESSARYRAAFALHGAWTTLVNRQPSRVRPEGTIGRLRTLNRELHMRFAAAMGAASRHRVPPAHLIPEVRQLIDQVEDLQRVPVAASDAIPLGHPSAGAAMREALEPVSNPMRIIVRVGVAALVAGALGSLFHLERAYWAIAATVLMLHQGFDWLRMLQRSIERLLGTWVGLLLAGAIVLWHPQGLWLVLTVMALQFTIEMFVMRNYALAVVFITGAALTIASGGHPVDDPSGYLLARGVDTLAGCLVALVVFRLIPPRSAELHIPEQIARVLRAVAETTAHLAAGNVTTPEARAARRQLQLASFSLTHAYEASLAASRGQRLAGEQLWPIVASVERLAYRVLSICWALETEAAAEIAVCDKEDAEHLSKIIEGFIAALVQGGTVPALGAVPAAVAAELAGLRECLLLYRRT
jgi:uncharacterized membrane protein YccC